MNWVGHSFKSQGWPSQNSHGVWTKALAFLFFFFFFSFILACGQIKQCCPAAFSLVLPFLP